MRRIIALAVGLAVASGALARCHTDSRSTDGTNATGGGSDAHFGDAGPAGGGGAGRDAGLASAGGGTSPASAGTDGGYTIADAGDGSPFPAIAPEPAPPDCGLGCRMFLNAPIDHPDYFSYQYSEIGVSDTNKAQLLYRAFKGAATLVIDTDPNGIQSGILQSSSHGLAIAYDHAGGADPNYVTDILWASLATGERRQLYHYERVDGGAGVLNVVLTSTYALFDLDQTGGMFRVAPSSPGSVIPLSGAPSYCRAICSLDDAILCGDGPIVRIDATTGATTPLAPTNALQIDGHCSPDRRTYAWVDFRDPPGNTSADAVLGGEIYFTELASTTIERLTFDSPEKPTPKVSAATDGDLVVWLELPQGLRSTPIFLGDLYNQATTLVRYDRTTKQRCRTSTWPGMWEIFVHDHEVIGYWLDAVKGERRMVAFDLTRPEIPWDCTGP